MTRAEFMARLKQGLVGLPTTTAADIVSDYRRPLRGRPGRRPHRGTGGVGASAIPTAWPAS